MATLKNTWQNGEQWNASNQNELADEVNGKYVKPAGGVPITDLTSGVQVSLGKADTAVQSVTSTSITDSTTTGRAVITATDAAAARTTLGVSYGTTSGTVVQGNDARLSPSSASITDSTATGRSLITATDAASARTTLGVAYGSTGGTVAQGNDARIVGAEQAANKGVANGYASLDGGGKVPVAQLPSSIMEYQGTFNASTGSPSLANGTGNTGDVYRVTVAGSQNFGAGSISFEVGDYVIYNGSVWEKSDTTDAVSTVAGLTGDVTASGLRGALGSGTPSSTNFLRGDGAWSTVGVSAIGASGTPSATTFLRGDGSWQPVSGISRNVSSITTATTLAAASGTDYVIFIGSNSTGDVFHQSVVTSYNCNGANNATTLSPNLALAAAGPVNLSMFNAAKLSTAVKKFGTASIYLDGTNGYVRTASQIAFGTGNWTIEGWFYPTVVGGFRTAFDIGTSGRPVFPAWSWYATVNNTTAGSAANVWYHIAAVRNGSNLTLYVNGTGATVANPVSDWGTGHVTFGFRDDLVNQPYTGYIDDIRITRAARYTANFTAPTTELAATEPHYGLPTLPTAVGNTNQYTLKNVTAGTITVDTTSSQTIDGLSASSFASSFSIASGASATLVSDGSNWRTV